jgi:hypothetical protein
MLRSAMVMLLAGCGAAAPAPRRLPSNRVLAPEGPAVIKLRAPLWLWCNVVGGEQCRRAQARLAVAAVTASELPAALFAGAWRDLDDDCADPQMQALRRELGEALGVAEDGWVDQIGELTIERIDVAVHGGGCTNATAPGVPDVKIQFGTEGRRTIAVVRVWELP